MGPDFVYVSGRKRPPGEMNGKSGNLNNCLQQLYPDEYDIPLNEVACVFDADQTALREFFVKTLPLFDAGDDVGMVLSPQVRSSSRMNYLAADIRLHQACLGRQPRPLYCLCAVCMVSILTLGQLQITQVLHHCTDSSAIAWQCPRHLASMASYVCHYAALPVHQLLVHFGPSLYPVHTHVCTEVLHSSRSVFAGKGTPMSIFIQSHSCTTCLHCSKNIFALQDQKQHIWI